MAKKIDANQRDRLVQLLPGYNCGICGYARCDEFAAALLRKRSQLEKCRFMYQELFDENRENVKEILKAENIIAPEEKVVGVLDGYEADFILKPLPEEQSCREVLYPFTREELKAGDIIRYRPLGCPIIHFARILEENHGLITVVMVGPCHRVDPEVDFPYKEVGICMVGGFEGLIDGKVPAVGETVRFLPGHCMMQKVHSGVVVQLEGRKAIIEGIDLKVWAPPIKG
ncbi:MAG TPA: (Fe-S)-binding protein [Methanobacteriaceae archaeon]|nr:(Fe-S)-binding protein [Methanobacteriaceae archaeon]